MNEKEKLIQSIMAECEADGEPVTREEAEEMAEMELKSKTHRRYEKAEVPVKRVAKQRPPRKPDNEKRAIIESIAHQLTRCIFENSEPEKISVENPEREITFNFNNNEYSIILTRHRKVKKVTPNV